MVRAWRVHEHGEPTAVLRLDELDEHDDSRAARSLGADEVRIAVAAASLNLADVLVCRGTYQVKPPLPAVPGSECAGTVTAVGAGVTGLVPGDRVMALAGLAGAFAEETVAAARSTRVIPAGMGFETAAALQVTYQTGHLALHHRGRIRSGDTLLVHAGAGGVGSAAIQLGRAAGARVFATAGGPAKVQVCRDLGAELAIDYRADDFVDAVKAATDGRGVDLVYDPVGGDTFDRSTKCIAFEGRIIVIGFTGGRFAQARTNHMLVKNYDVLGVAWGAYTTKDPDLVDHVHAELVRLYETGAIDPLISEVVDFDAIPRALERLAARGTTGKVVARIGT